jgi:hypothetical protein
MTDFFDILKDLENAGLITRKDQEDNGIEIIWEAEDDDGGACNLVKYPEGWQFSVTEGRFSGYPTVDLDFEDIRKLRDACNRVLGETDSEELDRQARAFGFEVARGKSIIGEMELSEDNPFRHQNWRTKLIDKEVG